MNSLPSTETPPSVAVTWIPTEDPLLRDQARALAETLGITANNACKDTPSFLLVYTAKGLELQAFNPEARSNFPALTVDFLHGSAGYRRLHGGGIHQPLARAAGLKPGRRPTIVDATAGLGGDGFILAALGCTVTLIERSPIMAALLRDGLARAAAHPPTSVVAERVQLLIGNSRELITTLAVPPDTIYLDPMYPHRRNSALNKQEMRIIRALVGDDADAAELLETACGVATGRVVVKRPKGAPQLNDRTPSHTIKMKNSRYDVYLTNKQKSGD